MLKQSQGKQFHLHDWSLIGFYINWQQAIIEIELLYATGKARMFVNDFTTLDVSQKNDWGKNISINSSNGPLSLENGLMSLEIEMQSGDLIKIEGKNFELWKD